MNLYMAAKGKVVSRELQVKADMLYSSGELL